MQAQEKFVGSNDLRALIMKGKRTKRQRSSSPFGLTVTSSSSSGGGGSGGVAQEYNSISSPMTSGEIYESTEEEEEMANCLIMLAQSNVPKRKCKTCNRSFPSFQALGGYMASHKKPKGAIAEQTKPLVLAVNDAVFALRVGNKANNNCNGRKGNKVHKCSICGSEFTSGQALGGHMRRHRAGSAAAAGNQAAMNVDTTSVSITRIDSRNDDDMRPRNIMSLDLNLPAPEDDLRDSKFEFGTPQQAIVFSTPALVDCHY